MPTITATQRTALQALFANLLAAYRSRYGPNTRLVAIMFSADANGTITGVTATIDVISAPDADGDVAQTRKHVPIYP